MNLISLLGSTFGLAFLSGINLYAATLTVGLSVRFNLITLPPELQGLAILAEPWILIAAGVLYLIEFAADKIPWVDTMWDTLHTFVRPLGAAAIGVAALQGTDPWVETLAVLACGGIGLSSHSTKAGARLLVNQSPEPFTNSAVSVVEDVVVVVGTWIFLSHPVIAITVVAMFLLAMIWIAPKLVRLILFEFAVLKGLFASLAGGQQGVVEGGESLAVPDGFQGALEELGAGGAIQLWVPAYSGRGCKPGRFFRGILATVPGKTVFITRCWFKTRCYEIDIPPGSRVEFKRQAIVSLLLITTKKGRVRIYCTRENVDAFAALSERIRVEVTEGIESN